MKLLSISMLVLGVSAANAANTWGTVTEAKTGYYNATAKHAVFTGSSPLIKFANAQLAAVARRSVNSFKKECAGMDKPRRPYSFEMKNDVVYTSPSLISTLSTVFWDTGGAHPNTNYTTQNFGMVNGVAKRIGLPELLKTGIRPAQIDDLIIAKLRDAGAEEAVQGNIPYFSPPQRDRFTINKSGLTFVFPPYEVGYYAQGSFRAHLTWNELSPFVKMDGILAQFRK